jgi:hypothetical protein
MKSTDIPLVKLENGLEILQRLNHLVCGVADALKNMTVRTEGKVTEDYQISCAIADFDLSGCISIIDCWNGLKEYDVTKQFVTDVLNRKLYSEQTEELAQSLSRAKRLLYNSRISTEYSSITESICSAFAKEVERIYAAQQQSRFEPLQKSVERYKQLMSKYRASELGMEEITTPSQMILFELATCIAHPLETSSNIIRNDISQLKQLLEYSTYCQESTNVRLELLFERLVELEGICATALSSRSSIFDVNKSEKQTAVDDATSKRELFSLGQADAIHRAVNGKQVEEISPSEMYHILNLHNTTSALKVRRGERGRMCYLIYFLGELILDQYRNEWRQTMCEQLGISKQFYHSKYKKAVSDDCTKADIDFVKRLDELKAMLRNLDNLR